MNRLAALALFALCLVALPAITGASSIPSLRARELAKSKYTQPHSLGDAYTFDPRDGWQTFNASNPHSRRGPTKNGKKKTSSEKSEKGLFGALHAFSQAVSKAIGIYGMQGQGESQSAIATWYTGHDLLNPSCWAQTQWAPTDDSFICALTLRGWNNKPMCFEFLQVCKTPEICIFIRVIDTCAGCKADSHHLDLSKGAFKQLGNPDEGVLTVQFRPASKPNNWFEELWGPQVNETSLHQHLA